MQEYIRDWKMAGEFYKSDNCYNREEDERFRMCRPQNNQSDRTCIKNNVKTSGEETREQSQILYWENIVWIQKRMWNQRSNISNEIAV